MDHVEQFAAIRRLEAERAAAAHRLRRECRRPGALMRFYVRLWWASRPRVTVWGLPWLETPVARTWP